MHIVSHFTPIVTARGEPNASLEQPLASSVRPQRRASPDVLAVETSISSSAMSSSTSEAPFFTSGSISSSTADPGSDSGEPGGVTKTALEWVFAITVLLAIASVTTWRYAQIRRRNQSMRSFLPRRRAHRSESRDQMLETRERRRSLPRTTGLPRPRTLSGASIPITDTLFYPPSLVHGRYPVPLEPAPVHLGHSAPYSEVERGRRTRRAARGADIDAYGRRGGRPDLDDPNGDDKDELPPYERIPVGGPPRYADVDVNHVGGSTLHERTLPMTVPESTPESVSTEREGAVGQGMRCEESSRTSSPDRNELTSIA